MRLTPLPPKEKKEKKKKEDIPGWGPLCRQSGSFSWLLRFPRANRMALTVHVAA
jgi:hypothetical protein